MTDRTTTNTNGNMIQPIQIVVKHRACSRCHRAKTACDGLQPCGRCTRLGADIASQCTAHRPKNESLADGPVNVSGRSRRTRRPVVKAQPSSSSSATSSHPHEPANQSDDSSNEEAQPHDSHIYEEQTQQQANREQVQPQMNLQQPSLHPQLLPTQQSQEQLIEQIRLAQMKQQQLREEYQRLQQQHALHAQEQLSQLPLQRPFPLAQSIQLAAAMLVNSTSPPAMGIGPLHSPLSFDPLMQSMGSPCIGPFGFCSPLNTNRSTSSGEMMFGVGNEAGGGFEEVHAPTTGHANPSSFLNSPNSPTRSIHINICTAVPAAAPLVVPATPSATVIPPVSNGIIAPPGGWPQSIEDEVLASKVREMVPSGAASSTPIEPPPPTVSDPSPATQLSKDDHQFASTSSSHTEDDTYARSPACVHLTTTGKLDGERPFRHERGPIPIPKKAYELLRTNRISERLKLLLDRRQVTARLIQYTFASRSEGLLESDFKELAQFVPIPVVASTKADFVHRKSFLEWQRQHMARIQAQNAVSRENDSGSSENTIGSTPTTSAPSPWLNDSASSNNGTRDEDVRLSSNLLPFDFDFTDSPLLCVEDELSAAGEFTLSDHLMHAQDPEIATIIVRTARSQEWKNGCPGAPNNSSSAQKKAADASQANNSMDVDSGCGSKNNRSNRKRPGGSHSRSRSRSNSPQSSERVADPSSVNLAESHRKRQRTHLNSGTDHRRATYPGSPPMNAESLALALDRRRNAFGSYQQPSQYDVVITDHDSRCPNHTHSAKVTSQIHENSSATGSGRTAMSDQGIDAQSQTCNCPQVVKRRMFIQVNRAWERLVGYSQKEVREIVIKEGWSRFSTNFVPQYHVYRELGWFEVMLSSTTDYHFVVPVSTKWSTQIMCMSQVHLMRTDDGDLDGFMHKFTPAPAPPRGN